MQGDFRKINDPWEINFGLDFVGGDMLWVCRMFNNVTITYAL